MRARCSIEQLGNADVGSMEISVSGLARADSLHLDAIARTLAPEIGPLSPAALPPADHERERRFFQPNTRSCVRPLLPQDAGSGSFGLAADSGLGELSIP